MRFERNGIERVYFVHKGRIIYLCACINCGEVHGFDGNYFLGNVDREIKCCDNPNNWYEFYGAKEIIDEFVRRWQDEE